MPITKSFLVDFCDGSAGLCYAVECDCERCNSMNKETAEERLRRGEKRKTSQKSES